MKMIMGPACLLSAAAVTLTLGFASPAMADEVNRVSACEKGSLLIIPNVEVRWKNVAPYDVVQDTFIHLTNDYPAAVDVKMYFLNGDPPEFSATWSGDPVEFLDAVMRERMSESRREETHDLELAGGGDTPRDHPGWNFLDNLITLTANEPAYWSAATGLPKGVSPWEVLDPDEEGPGRVDPDTSERFLRGFIVAFAVQQVPVGDEIRWNHLAADATIVHYTNEYAWQYCAYAYRVNRDLFNHGDPTGTPGVLNIDNSEYGPSYAELLFNFIASGSDAYTGGGLDIVHDSDLTLMPVDTDFRQENEGPAITKASFDIWNENEVKFTNLDRCVSCWDQELLSRHAIPNHFLVGALGTDAGKARIEGLESFLCDQSRASSLIGVIMKRLSFATGGMAAGGNLHGLGIEPAVILYDSHDPPPESRGGAEFSVRN